MPHTLLVLLCWITFAPVPVLAARVTAVLDGDTIELADGTVVRYVGVNTPERGQRFSEEARQYNAHLVLGKTVRLADAGQEQDRYRRRLAYVYVGDVLVNAQLIAEGWAHLFVLAPLPPYQEWLQLQKDAQAQRKGMWRAGGVSGPLKITTLQADAEGDDRRNVNGEYVRVCNVSTEPVTLTGFAVQDAQGRRYRFPGGTLDPGYTALLLSGKGRDTAHRGQLLFYWGSVQPIWNNRSETALLFDPEGNLIDSFTVDAP